MRSPRAAVTNEVRHRAGQAATAAARLLEAYGLIDPPEERPASLPPGAILALPARGEMLYRLLSSDEVRERDFFSNHDKDRPPLVGTDHVIHCGVSMFARPDQALIRANRYPVAVAAITLAAGMGVTLAKTFGAGHYTVWGDPPILQSQAQLLTVVSG